jgi:hypothetical protein
MFTSCRLLAVCIVVAAATAACGGSSNDAFIGAPSPSPSGVTLTASPSALSLDGTGATFAQTAQVQEPGYSGAFAETDTCSGVATVTPNAGTGPSQTYTVTGVTAGTCAIRISDTNAQHATIAVTVTTAGVGVNSGERPHS